MPAIAVEILFFLFFLFVILLIYSRESTINKKDLLGGLTEINNTLKDIPEKSAQKLVAELRKANAIIINIAEMQSDNSTETTKTKKDNQV